MATKKFSKKAAAKSTKCLFMEAYKEVINELVDNVNAITLHPITQDKYSLGPMYYVTDDNMAYSFSKFADMLFVEKIKVDLGMWFESKEPLVS